MNTRGKQLQARVEELMGRIEELERMLGKCTCGEKETSSDKVESDAETLKVDKEGSRPGGGTLAKSEQDMNTFAGGRDDVTEDSTGEGAADVGQDIELGSGVGLKGDELKVEQAKGTGGEGKVKQATGHDGGEEAEQAREPEKGDRRAIQAQGPEGGDEKVEQSRDPKVADGKEEQAKGPEGGVGKVERAKRPGGGKVEQAKGPEGGDEKYFSFGKYVEQASEEPPVLETYSQVAARTPTGVVYSKAQGAGSKDTDKEASTGRVIQAGTWSYEGGSRFWRPQTTKKEASSSVNLEGGSCRVESGSRVWTRQKNEGQDQEAWKEVKYGPKGAIIGQAPPVITSNSFSALVVDEGGKEEVDILVVGDSRVRPLRRTFCGRRDKCIVKPGAKITDVDSVIRTELERTNPEKVIVQVGVNNVGPRASVRIVSEYRSLLQRLSGARKPVFVTGILPRLWASSEWYSRALALNSAVKQMCSDMGLHFVDKWEVFHRCERYYIRDGLHLSDEGARVLGAYYREAISGN